ncbi:MAG: biopolymer transporter ExbD [Burkholderiales bacterium]|nr:biopolymer transporter ExbD [Burkholderiales bacterium]
MAFGGFSEGDSARPMAEINMIPLIDVMLVLLVIFIVTAPLLTHAIRVDLPEATAQVSMSPPQSIDLTIDGQGQLFWDSRKIEKSELERRFVTISGQNPQPQLRLRAERTTQYQVLAEVLALAQTTGVTRLAFITEPTRR